jgi:acyl-CoA synthetase (AMP-forming)/AMP-acid ligase II
MVIFLPNSTESVLGIFATLKAGGTFVVCNHTTKKDKLLYILNNCRATGIITNLRNEKLIKELQPQVPSLKFALIAGPARDESEIDEGAFPVQSIANVLDSAPTDQPSTVNIDLDLAGLIYTSGSTGDPKGVMCDHSNIDFATGSIITYLENVEDDIVLNVLPLSFDYGLYQLLMTFKFGGTLVLEQSFTYPAAILKKMEEEKVTGFPGVPTIFAILVQMDLSQYDLSSLRYLTNTAAALPPSHIQELQNKFSWATLYSMYGLTETKRTLYLPPDQLDIRPGSVGIAIPGTEVWIEDEEGHRLGPGEVGELVIRGSHVMRGYWENPEATTKRYRPGPIPGERLCYSDDLFRMDEEGYLYFVGRKDDIIKSRGEKVAPKEVENTLYKIPSVVEAAVIGVPDPVLGESIKAFVVTEDPDLKEAKIIAFCRANLEDFMVPQKVEILAELPKTSSGKIKKTGLS